MRLPSEQDATTKAAVHAPAADTAAVVTLAATTGEIWHIYSIQWSYSAAPTGGALTVVAGSTTILTLAVTAAGPNSIEFPKGLSRNVRGEAVVVTLAAPGGAVVGKLNVQYR